MAAQVSVPIISPIHLRHTLTDSGINFPVDTNTHISYYPCDPYPEGVLAHQVGSYMDANAVDMRRVF